MMFIQTKKRLLSSMIGEKQNLLVNTLQVKVLKKKLEQRGYRCWLDLDYMDHDMTGLAYNIDVNRYLSGKN